MDFNHRLADLEDIPKIKELMQHSINKLLGNYVNEGELEASFEFVIAVGDINSSDSFLA